MLARLGPGAAAGGAGGLGATLLHLLFYQPTAPLPQWVAEPPRPAHALDLPECACAEEEAAGGREGARRIYVGVTGNYMALGDVTQAFPRLLHNHCGPGCAWRGRARRPYLLSSACTLHVLAAPATIRYWAF